MNLCITLQLEARTAGEIFSDHRVNSAKRGSTAVIGRAKDSDDRGMGGDGNVHQSAIVANDKRTSFDQSRYLFQRSATGCNYNAPIDAISPLTDHLYFICRTEHKQAR